MKIFAIVIRQQLDDLISQAYLVNPCVKRCVRKEMKYGAYRWTYQYLKRETEMINYGDDILGL